MTTQESHDQVRREIAQLFAFHNQDATKIAKIDGLEMGVNALRNWTEAKERADHDRDIANARREERERMEAAQEAANLARDKKHGNFLKFAAAVGGILVVALNIYLVLSRR